MDLVGLIIAEAKRSETNSHFFLGHFTPPGLPPQAHRPPPPGSPLITITTTLTACVSKIDGFAYFGGVRVLLFLLVWFSDVS